ncbi:MAG: bifunctional diaminohydroxyphosphoribosylaminopyrimidine deaminase/5-amino-6-(5-phosphoribosylamino)uracil reductase RibD [Xanthomonadales bacterium]|nr:bifunctional diaminohydroxyphosphoribosylaminopyrimidine deaminase/5-amino-6-(5-phosphoribosylamino)uracil reductase RibD [Gammaproteobacteria bacterium]NND56635.1 bifunctional diaminohydroxyphosphoribosylaminopyrimidine deaminase/5-amino-6-(5-phosphoribosylamino)uracil reductase RibD [Xanthomonadales bacterium]NNK52423.1 bifunctional diaminohydroxyphosphoribosylaminopyrimidine deaminase/5-amino-6-(5-phosphoribosylamino)uracil reductase RibD [Xanthomonadales bacterium]
MAAALRLARKGLYTTDPNPRVGCVLAHDERVIGNGWHRRAGGAHAEIAAMRDADSSVAGSTVYVTLEPCSIHGRTPPCAKALIEARVARVIVAAQDPNPAVNGGGMKYLRDAGVTVESGLMAEEAETLNVGFSSRMKSGRPWIRVKTAISLDGRTALRTGESQWISGEASRADVQRWRARSSAILTGIGTVLADNPSMNARVDQPVVQPLRVVVDRQWRTPPDSRIVAGQGDVLIAGDRSISVPAALTSSKAECLGLPAKDGRVNLRALFNALAEREVNEVQVEAGSRLCGSLYNERLVDEILIYQAPVLLGDGGPGPFALGPLESMADRAHFKVLEVSHLGNDLRYRLQPEFRS